MAPFQWRTFALALTACALLAGATFLSAGSCGGGGGGMESPARLGAR